METLYSEKFRELMKRTLQSRGITATDLTRILRLSSTYVGHMVNRGLVPSPNILERIEEAFPEIKDELLTAAYAYQVKLPNRLRDRIDVALAGVPLPKEAKDRIRDYAEEVQREYAGQFSGGGN